MAFLDADEDWPTEETLAVSDDLLIEPDYRATLIRLSKAGIPFDRSSHPLLTLEQARDEAYVAALIRLQEEAELERGVDVFVASSLSAEKAHSDAFVQAVIDLSKRGVPLAEYEYADGVRSLLAELTVEEAQDPDFMARLAEGGDIEAARRPAAER